VFLICFSVDSPESLISVETKWIPEVLHFCPSTPYILIGCKADLRKGQTPEELKRLGSGVVSKEEGKLAAQRIGAGLYMECSAKTGEGLVEVFNQAARTSLSAPNRAGHGNCVVS
jgi:Ras homolog gene family, member A